jgi:hypothetical protein
MSNLTHDYHYVNGAVPVADAFATSLTTDYISTANYGRITFIIHTGNATSGTANGTVTVLASAVAAGSSTTALAFKYRVCAASTTVDTWGAWTDAAAAGFSMTAGDNYIYEVTVQSDEVQAQAAGKYFVACKVTEVTNDPIDAGILVRLDNARYPQAVPVQAIA